MEDRNFWLADVQLDREPDIDQVERLSKLLPLEPREALSGLQQLVDRGSLAAALHIAAHFDKSATGAHDEIQSIKWYRRAAEMGSRAARYQYGVKLALNGNLPGAEAAFKDGADMEFPPSMYRLAGIYIDKDDTSYDGEILALLQKASTKGHLFSTRDYMTRLLSGRHGEIERLRGVSMIPVFVFRMGRFLLRALTRGPELDETIYA